MKKKRRQFTIYSVWTDIDGAMKKHEFAAGKCLKGREQESADWWAANLKGYGLECYVQIHDRNGAILASAGNPHEAKIH